MNRQFLNETLDKLSRQVLYSLRQSARLNLADSPIVQLVDLILHHAVDVKATDIHIEPQSDRLRIRYRLDGMLTELHKPLDSALISTFISRVKIMSAMDTTKSHLPLDGRIDFIHDGRKIDMRSASMPTAHGETLVIRLMDVEENLKTIGELGMSVRTEEIFRRLIGLPSGMFVVAGPMNSGKSTSLYAALRELNRGERNIMTLEDPIEQLLDGINQTDLSGVGEFNFADGLRSMMRMDCNVIMVGEIRDVETAKTAIRAALTGHLLLTTLHAKDTCSALFRLLEMEVEPYLLAATLSGVMSQRLVRRLCSNCRREYEVEASSIEAELLGKNFERGMKMFRAEGCEKCRGTGYRGRLALHEILPIDDRMRSMILKFSSIDEIKRTALENGLVTLPDDGIKKAAEGLTTLDELRRVIAS